MGANDPRSDSDWGRRSVIGGICEPRPLPAAPSSDERGEQRPKCSRPVAHRRLLPQRCLPKSLPELRRPEIRIVAEPLTPPSRFDDSTFHFSPTRQLLTRVPIGGDAHITGTIVSPPSPIARAKGPCAVQCLDQLDIVGGVERLAPELGSATPSLAPQTGPAPKGQDLQPRVVGDCRQPAQDTKIPGLSECVLLERLERFDRILGGLLQDSGLGEIDHAAQNPSSANSGRSSRNVPALRVASNIGAPVPITAPGRRAAPRRAP